MATQSDWNKLEAELERPNRRVTREELFDILRSINDRTSLPEGLFKAAELLVAQQGD